MRDPNRIDPMLHALGEFWRAHPDWRLCQVVVNVAGMNDPFYVEDDAFAERLRNDAAALTKEETS